MLAKVRFGKFAGTTTEIGESVGNLDSMENV